MTEALETDFETATAQLRYGLHVGKHFYQKQADRIAWLRRSGAIVTHIAGGLSSIGGTALTDLPFPKAASYSAIAAVLVSIGLHTTKAFDFLERELRLKELEADFRARAQRLTALEVKAFARPLLRAEVLAYLGEIKELSPRWGRRCMAKCHNEAMELYGFSRAYWARRTPWRRITGIGLTPKRNLINNREEFVRKMGMALVDG